MKRRDFLKMAGLAGAASLPLYPVELLANHPDSYQGPLYLLIEANGGWDPTSLFDPKGYSNKVSTDVTTYINDYPAANIGTIGGIRYAPPPDGFTQGGNAGLFGDFTGTYNASSATAYTADKFLTKYADRMIVLNGIDYQTASHEVGQRNGWSGFRNRSGTPNFGALVAGLDGNDRALPFLSSGEYDETGGLTVAIPINDRGLDAMYELARPGLTDPDNTGSAPYLTPAATARLQQAHDARTAAMLGTSGDIFEQRLIRIRTSIDAWRTADRGREHLSQFADDLQAGNRINTAQFNLQNSSADNPRMGNAFDLYSQGRIALAAYQSGVSMSAFIRMGGYDTHGNHDRSHYPRLMNFMLGIDAIIQEIDIRGLRDRVVIIVGSDFARTNHFNTDNGKDHWSIGSNLIIGPGSGRSIQVASGVTRTINGGRVFGSTTADQRAQNVDINGVFNPNGFKINPAHIHQALREFANVDTNPRVLQPDLNLNVPSDQRLNLFS